MIRKALLPGLIVLVGLGLLVSSFRGPISAALLSRALETRLAADPRADYADGLHVVLCGAGGPLPDPDRSAPCLLLIAGEHVYLVDAGSGAARNIAGVGFQPGMIEGVFLTHLHSDHIDGLGELGILRWVGSGAKSPLPLFGAEGVDDIADGLNEVYRLDSIYRTTHHGPKVAPPTGSGYRARPFDEPPAGETVVVMEKGGLRVSAFQVDHAPVQPAVGYRFEYKGRSVVVSGDTARSENLVRFAKGADLLVHEALSPELMGLIQGAATRVGNEGMAKIAYDVLDYHTHPREVAEIAEQVGAKHLLFYHVVPAMPIPGLSAIFLDGVAELYSGPFTLGRDGTSISLPADSDVIDVTRD